MKKSSPFLIMLFIILAAFYSGPLFSNSSNVPNVNPPDEFELLVKYLENNSSFIYNNIDLIINADEVKKNLKNEKYHIIDIRSDSWFEYGHIKGAKNLKTGDLLEYFQNTINAQDYDKIILVCYSGQSASYFSGLLRIAGYNNVYSMKWGMSSWREDFAEGYWQKFIGNSYADQIETSENEKPTMGLHPSMTTGKSVAEEILNTRLTELFKIPYKNYIVKLDELSENSNNYYIINYTEKENFDLGHIAGAINYLPGTSLTTSTDLLTLPTDQKIVVYDNTGLKSAYVVAYLNVLGYDVGNLAYGANGFINDKLKKHNLDAFTNKEINMYPVIE